MKNLLKSGSFSLFISIYIINPPIFPKTPYVDEILPNFHNSLKSCGITRQAFLTSKNNISSISTSIKFHKFLVFTLLSLFFLLKKSSKLTPTKGFIKICPADPFQKTFLFPFSGGEKAK